MSASTERKNRIAAIEAGTDKKTNARLEEEKKAAKSRRRWTWGTIGVAILLVLIILLNTGFIYTHTTAAVSGSRRYSPAEINYYYNTQYMKFVNTYGSYASIFGLDTSNGTATLDEQACTMLGEGKTWRDYFIDSSLASVSQVTALCDYAKTAGVTLTDEELADIDANIEEIKASAALYGYSNLNGFLAAQYGNGVNAKLVRQMLIDSTLASKVLDDYNASLEFSDTELKEKYASYEGSRDYFDYLSFFVKAATVPAEGAAEGETTEAAPAEGAAEGETAEAAPTEQTLLEARMTAQAIETAYKDGGDIDDVLKRFNAAIEAEYEDNGETAADEYRSAAGSDLGDASEWLMSSSRKSGDVTVLESSGGDGYYVVVYISREDNSYNLVSVRHILIQAETDENGNVSPETQKAALDRINEIKAEFEATDRSEESFAALAEKYSEDEGSKANGGLYENIYKGMMVDSFNDFCFAGHKSGDIAVVYGENSNYSGYHLIYFVGEGEPYCDYIARTDLASEAETNFITERTEGYEAELRFWSKFVG